MNKHRVERLSKKKLEVKKYSKEQAEELAKSMGLKLSENYGKPTNPVEEEENDNSDEVRED